MGPVAQAVLQGVEDQVLLDIGDRAADQAASAFTGSAVLRGADRCQGLCVALARRLAGAGQQYFVRAYDTVAGQQHGAVHGVLQLAHIAPPMMAFEHVLSFSGEFR